MFRLMPAVLFFLLAFVWLNPYTYGPYSTVFQTIIVWMIASVWCLSLHRRTPEQTTTTIIQAWYAAACISAAMGVLQYLGATEGLAWLINSGPVGQAYGNLRQRNQFATLLNMGLAAWWIWGQPQAGKYKVWGWLGVGLLAGANALSGSRTGLLQLLLVIALAFVWKKNKAVAGLAVLAYVGAAVLMPWAAGLDVSSSGILGRAYEVSARCNLRQVLWANVWDLVLALPWAGWGWGELGYAHFVTLFYPERFCWILDNAHNLPLQLAVTLGLPIATLVCGGVLWMVWRGRPWAEVRPERQVAWAVLACIGLHSLLEFPLWYGPFQLAAVLSVYLLWATPRHYGPETHTALDTVPRKVWILLAAFTMALCCWVGWDYLRIAQLYLPPEQRLAAYREDTFSKVQGVTFFKNYVKFATLNSTPLRADNAQYLHDLALDLLHFSAEERVVFVLIESARLLGLANEVAFYQARAQAAFGKTF